MGKLVKKILIMEMGLKRENQISRTRPKFITTFEDRMKTGITRDDQYDPDKCYVRRFVKTDSENRFRYTLQQDRDKNNYLERTRLIKIQKSKNKVYKN